MDQLLSVVVDGRPEMLLEWVNDGVDEMSRKPYDICVYSPDKLCVLKSVEVKSSKPGEPVKLSFRELLKARDQEDYYDLYLVTPARGGGTAPVVTRYRQLWKLLCEGSIDAHLVMYLDHADGKEYQAESQSEASDIF